MNSVEKSRKIRFIEKRGKIVHRFLIKRTFKTQKVPVLVTNESHQKHEGPFLRLEMFLSNVQKGIFSVVERDVLKSAKKVPLKKRRFQAIRKAFYMLLVGRCQRFGAIS